MDARTGSVLVHAARVTMPNPPALTPPTPTRLRVLIADDHTLFAEALEAILATDERFDVVGQARNGEDALGLAPRPSRT